MQRHPIIKIMKAREIGSVDSYTPASEWVGILQTSLRAITGADLNPSIPTWKSPKVNLPWDAFGNGTRGCSTAVLHMELS